MSGQDLQVLAAAFEQCQATVSSRASSITEIAAQLRQLRGVLGDRDVGGDACEQLAQQVDQFAAGLEQLGGRSGVAGVAAGIGQILEKFHEVDRSQAANAHLLP